MRLGKPDRKVMEAISRLAGARSSQILVGSQPGVDVSILRVDHGTVMVASCDPISLIPSIGPKESAAMSVYELASDVATSGTLPKFAMVDLNLPPHISDRVLREYWRSFHETCTQLGLSVVGGHTGRFEGCDYSVIGGATLWTFCGDGQYVTSSMGEDGDDLILTKSAAYGATAVLTRAFPRTVRRALGSSIFEKAWEYFPQANIVQDAVTAASVGIHERGVTAMHDATEGGVLSAIKEMSDSSRLGAIVDFAEIPVSEETLQVCKLFRIDPLISLGEGSLVISSKPHRTKAVALRLRSKGIDCKIVGRFSSKIRGVRSGGEKRSRPLLYPRTDPYWRAYWRAVRRGWS